MRIAGDQSICIWTGILSGFGHGGLLIFTILQNFNDAFVVWLFVLQEFIEMTCFNV